MPSGSTATPRQPEQTGDRDAAPAVVAGGRPDRAMTGRVELPGDEPRRQASVGGEHLVRADHRERSPSATTIVASTPVSSRAARRDRARRRRRPGSRRCTSARGTGSADRAASAPTPASALARWAERGRGRKLAERRQSHADSRSPATVRSRARVSTTWLLAVELVVSTPPPETRPSPRLGTSRHGAFGASSHRRSVDPRIVGPAFAAFGQVDGLFPRLHDRSD